MRQKTLYSLSDKERELDLDWIDRVITFRPKSKSAIKKSIGKVYTIRLDFSDLIFSPIPQLKCIQCGFFGRTYWCPPHVAPYYRWKKIASKYNFFRLIVGEIDLTPRIEEHIKVYKAPEWQAYYYAGAEGTSIIKAQVKKRRMEIYKYLSSFGKARFWDEGGGCRKGCKPCAIETGEKCRHLGEVAPAPEGTGIELYTMLRQYIPDFQIPPMTKVWSVSMVAAQIPDYEEKNKTSKIDPKPIKYEFPNEDKVVNVYKVEEIWDPEYCKQQCENCKLWSDILCNRKWYLEEDLFNRIKDMKLYVVRLNNSNKTKEGIDELYQYQVSLHRQGCWWSFQMLPYRCPICKDCSLKTHRGGGYKIVTNRHIPFCSQFFNLKVSEKGEYIGYIMV